MVDFSFLLVKFFLLNCQPGSPLRARGSKLRSRDAGEGRDREAAGTVQSLEEEAHAGGGGAGGLRK